MRKLLMALALLPFFFPGQAQAASPKLYLQWAQSSPGDWSLVSTSTWDNQPTKSNPTDISNGTIIGDSLLDNQKGYVFALNVQGVIFNWYDHYAVTGTDTSVTVTAWRDDPTLFPTGHRQADVAVINSLKFDAKVGQENTDQTFTFYREGSEYDSSNPQHRPYSEFIAPTSGVKPGIYISDSKWNEHIAAETLKGWR